MFLLDHTIFLTVYVSFNTALLFATVNNYSTRELGVGGRQFHAGVNGFILFIFYNITLS